MKITMQETTLGSPNGYDVRSYRDGQTYDVPAVLGKAFVNSGAAVPASGPPDEREIKVDAPSESKPDSPAEASTDAEADVSASASVTKADGDEEQAVTYMPTKQGSPWYRFRDAEGEVILKEDGEPLKVMGEDKAKEMAESLSGAGA